MSLKLEGSSSNRAAIGARIKVVARTSDGTPKEVYALVNTGGSFGCSSLQQEIGSGDATIIDRIEIVWPNKERGLQYFVDVPINKRYHIKEGEMELSIMEQAAFEFKTGESHRHHHHQ